MPAEVAKSAISIAQKLARGSILLLSGLGKKPNPLSLSLSTPQTIKKIIKRKKHTPPLSTTKPRMMNFPNTLGTRLFSSRKPKSSDLLLRYRHDRWMEKELVSELADQPKEEKKNPPLSKKKKDISNRKKKKTPITKNKKNKQTTTTTRETKCERQTKNNTSFSPQSQALENKQQNLHKILHKTMSIIL